MSDSLCRGLIISVLFCTGLVASANAAKLYDPMRPAPGYQSEITDAKKSEVASDGWILQSTLLGKERAVAVIDGVPVARGEKYRGAKLLSVKRDEVTLQRRNGKKIVLTLTPGILKQVSVDMEIRPK